MSWAGIGENVVSDFIYTLLILLFLGLARLLYHRMCLSKGRGFFGFAERMPIKIYVSGFEHPGVKTKRVVNALEYEAAVELKRVLRQLSGGGFIGRVMRFLAGLIGQKAQIPEPEIEVSPLEEVTSAPYLGPVISIGGPVANQVTRFYLRDAPRFRFAKARGKYQERDRGQYRDLVPSSDVAVIEKMTVGDQTVILIHGFGEEQTCRAVQHLIRNWKVLYRRYGHGEFGVRV